MSYNYVTKETILFTIMTEGFVGSKVLKGIREVQSVVTQRLVAQYTD